VIKVANAKEENKKNTIEKISSELNGKIINYFGEQRFGSNRKTRTS